MRHSSNDRWSLLPEGPVQEKRPTLSAVVITRDEELNLPGLLVNLSNWVDEIVVVDDGSIDGTLGILEDAGEQVRVVSHPMSDEGGYAGQRNAGMDVATGDWLLHMDCDERVSPALARDMFEAIARTNMNAFRYRRLNYFLHRPMRHGGWNTWNRPQLARQGKHRFEGILHERCVVEGGDDATGQLSGTMLHLNDASFAQRLEKSGRYVTLQAELLLKQPVKISVFSILGNPIAEFMKLYVLRRGFLDGTPGLIAALHSATAVFRTYALAWDRKHAIDRTCLEADLARRWQQYRQSGVGGGKYGGAS